MNLYPRKKGRVVKYELKTKSEKPQFEYLVQCGSGYDYYLFRDFDSALQCVVKVSLQVREARIFEVCFDPVEREFHGRNAFTAFLGKVIYEKYAQPALHIQFYTGAGEWLNPNELT